MSHRARKVVPSHEGASTMSVNAIQFQPGMSLVEFLGRFGTEPQCAEAIRQAR